MHKGQNENGKAPRTPFTRKQGHLDNVSINALFTLREMKTQLEWCKDTAPGPDDIMISMIKNLATPAKLTLLIAQ